MNENKNENENDRKIQTIMRKIKTKQIKQRLSKKSANFFPTPNEYRYI